MSLLSYGDGGNGRRKKEITPVHVKENYGRAIGPCGFLWAMCDYACEVCEMNPDVHTKEKK